MVVKTPSRIAGGRPDSVNVFPAHIEVSPYNKLLRLWADEGSYSREATVGRKLLGRFKSQFPDEVEILFSELAETADEFGICRPSDALVDDARRVFGALYWKNSGACLIYLMPDGAVAIDIRGNSPDGILIRLKPDGSAHCSGEVGGKFWRKAYSSAGVLPDSTVLDELVKLG